MFFDSINVLTKKQRELTLRMVKASEAQDLIDAVAEIAETSPYILLTAEDFRSISIEDEIKWINSYNDDSRSILIVVEFENKIVGVLDFRAYKGPKSLHRGGLGISLNENIRGEGVGELLFKKLITELKKVNDLKMLELSVMSENIQAYHLYKKVGFIEIGRRPKAYKQPDGSYTDEVMMVLEL